MTDHPRQSKVASMVKNADLYDLIRISLRSSDNKVSAVDRYIKRALDRQINNQVTVIDDNESIMAGSIDGNLLQTKDSQHQKTMSTATVQCKAESPIKEMRKKENSMMSSPQKSTYSHNNSTILHSPFKHSFDSTQILQPLNLNDTVQHVTIQPSPAKKSQIVSCKQHSPYKTTQLDDDQQQPPSPKKDQPPTPTASEIYLQCPVQDQTYVSQVSQDLQELQKQWQMDKSPKVQQQSRYQQQTKSSQNRQRSQVPEESTPTSKGGIFVYSSSSQHKHITKGLARSISTNALEQHCTFSKKPVDIKSPSQTHRSSSKQHSSGSKMTNRVALSNRSTLLIQDPTLPKSDMSTLRNPKKVAYDDLINKHVQKIAQQYLKKPVSMKHKLLNSFSMINLSLFVEIERIKKPQKQALQAGRMLCMLVSIFRDKPMDFTSWSQIQGYVNQNVNKFTQEILALKQKILDGSTRQYVEKLQRLNQEFFIGGNVQQMQNHIANKQLKVIVSFVYNIVNYILAKDQGKEDEPCFDEDISQINHQEHTPSEVAHPQLNINDETPKHSVKRDASPLVPQSTRNYTQKIKANVSPKPNKTKKDQSPFRATIKHKFIQPVQQDKKVVKDTTPKKETVKEVTPKKEVVPQMRHSTGKNQQYQSLSKRLSQIDPKQRDISNTRRSIVPQTSRNIQLTKRDSLKSPLSTIVHTVSPSQCQQLTFSKQPSQKQEYKIEVTDTETEQTQEQLTSEESFQISPQRVKQARREHSELSQMIIQKSYQIEANMENNIKKQIDLSIIEELKRRRAEQRVRGQELESKREEIIYQVQMKMQNDLM